MKDIIELEGFELSIGETQKQKVAKYLKQNKFAFAIGINKSLKIPISTVLYILKELVEEGYAIDMGMTNAKINNRNRQVRLFKKS